MSETNETRLNKYISESGLCSRREADGYIEKGHVLINGRKAHIGDKVRAGDRVMVNGQEIEAKPKEEEILIAFNKPIGIVCTTELGVRDNIIDYLKFGERIFPIGRLDKESQGLIFLTSNGDIVNKILRAGNKHEKEYLVTVNKPVTDAFVENMSHGVPIMGVNTRKCVVIKEAPFVFRIILLQGLNRQIRRMCEHFGFEVTKLERIRIMNVSVKGIGVGTWRDLTKDEKDGIMEMIGSSSDAPPPRKKAAKKPTEARPDKKSNARPHAGTAKGAGRKSSEKPHSSAGASKTTSSGPKKKRSTPGHKPYFPGAAGSKKSSGGRRGRR
jgi:23S rRNA pseudouridine2604 synthase